MLSLQNQVSSKDQEVVLEKKILILGDFLVDKTTKIRPLKFSAEGPWPIYELVGESSLSPGGAGLAAAYSREHSVFLTTSKLFEYEYTQRWLSKYRIAYCPVYIKSAEKFPVEETIEKHRFVGAESGIQIFRLDNDSSCSPRDVDPKRLKGMIHASLEMYDIKGVLLLDYRKGYFTKDVIKTVFDSIPKEIDIFVDSKDPDTMDLFVGATVFKANKKEMLDILEHEGIANRLFEGAIVIKTLGKDGASLFKWGCKEYSYTANAQGCGIANVSGCGDVFSFNFCYYRFIEGLPWEEALQCAVMAATDYAYMPVDRRLEDGFRTTSTQLRASMPRLSR